MSQMKSRVILNSFLFYLNDFWKSHRLIYFQEKFLPIDRHCKNHFI